MNAATRARKHAQKSTTDWLWEDLPDPFATFEQRHDPAGNTTGVDFEANKQRELHEFAGRVTRIDLIELPDGTQVKRTWLAGWAPSDPAFEAKPLEAGWTVASAAEHLKAQGWAVRYWTETSGTTCARAFRCGLRCVRTGGYRNRWSERRGAEIAAAVLDDRFDG